MKQMRRLVAMLLVMTTIVANCLGNVSHATEIVDTEIITGEITTQEQTEGTEEVSEVENNTTEEALVTEEKTEDSVVKEEVEKTDEIQEISVPQAENNESDMKRKYTFNGYNVLIEVSSVWENAFNANVTIENTGSEKIENWYLVFKMPNEISNIWNAEIDKKEEDVYTIRNAHWNQDIRAGESVSFGFTAHGDIKTLPDTFSMPGQIIEVDSDVYSIEYVITEDWIEGYNASITIINNTDSDLQDWQMEFDYDNDITQMWDATITEHQGSHYLITNNTYNSDVPSKGKVTFGFNVSNGSSDVLLNNVRVYESKLGNIPESEIGKYVLLSGEITEDTNSLTLYVDSVYRAVPYNIYLKENGTEEEIVTELEDSNYTMSLNDRGDKFSCFVTQKIDDEIIVSNELVVKKVNGKYEIEIIDTDDDGIEDYLEKSIGTNCNKSDTDNDGLTDYFEWINLGTDPTNVDTDGNGVSDDKEDADKDKLLNIGEMQYGTDPLDSDTDKDKLTDYDEIFTYKTDPLDNDTDWDYMEDGDEITFGKNPLMEDENGDEIEDGYELYTVELDSSDIENDGVVIPSVKVEMEGCFIPTLFVNQIDNTDPYINDSIPGYIGSAYDFNVSDQIRDDLKATITYEFDAKLLKDKDFVPAIYYFNEEKMKLEKVENQHIVNNSVVADVTHFSIYILLNSEKIDDVIDVTFGEANAVELVIDGSGSMKNNDAKNIRYDCADKFISRLSNDDLISVIGFDRYTQIRQDFTKDKKKAKAAVRETYTGGNTDICRAIKTGISEFDKVSDDKEKYMILLTDGASSTTDVDSILADANEKEITIYTIGLGKGVNASFLKKIADETGGEYYFASVAEDLPDIFDGLQETEITQLGGSKEKSWFPTSTVAQAVSKAGFTYDFDRDIITSKVKCHQAGYGYTYFYDECSPLIQGNIDCEPIYFFYDNKEYMIEFWKGQYGIETGGEIGVYFRGAKKGLNLVEKKKGKWYQTNVDDTWNMKLEVGENVPNDIFSIGKEHWWLTGFKWGRYVGYPDTLKMVASITFPDSGMKDAFIKGYDKRGERYYQEAKKAKKHKNFLKNDDHSDDAIYGLEERGYICKNKNNNTFKDRTYSVSGNTVTVYFGNPICSQPEKLVKKRSTLRKQTYKEIQFYRDVKWMNCELKDIPFNSNDPNNIDKKLFVKFNNEETMKFLKLLNKNNGDIFDKYNRYVYDMNKKLAKKMSIAIEEGDYKDLKNNEIKALRKILNKYYEELYKGLDYCVPDVIDKAMGTGENIVKGIMQ